jgi:hypothetical protein
MQTRGRVLRECMVLTSYDWASSKCLSFYSHVIALEIVTYHYHGIITKVVQKLQFL